MVSLADLLHPWVGGSSAKLNNQAQDLVFGHTYFSCRHNVDKFMYPDSASTHYVEAIPHPQSRFQSLSELNIWFNLSRP